MKFAMLDIEASGLHSASFPIELGWCKAQGEARSALIRPHFSWSRETWDPVAQALHGISLAQLESEGRHSAHACTLLDLELSGYVLLSDAPDFDQHWLSMIWKAARRTDCPTLVDVWQWAAAETKWSATQQAIQIERFSESSKGRVERHRAGPDSAALFGFIASSLAL